jgi:hypothetical protein
VEYRTLNAYNSRTAGSAQTAEPPLQRLAAIFGFVEAGPALSERARDLSSWNIKPSTNTIRELPVRYKSPNRLYKDLQPCNFAERISDSTRSTIEDADGSSSRFAASLGALFSQMTNVRYG